MNVEHNAVYFFKMQSEFSQLDGIYKILDILPYGRILSEELDLIELLYAHVGKTKADLNEVIADYVNHPFYMIERTSDKTVLCIPDPIVRSADINVAEYYATMLTIDLGLLQDPAYSLPVATSVEADIARMFGGKLEVDEQGEPLVDPVILSPKVEIQVYSKKWLRSDDYADIVTERKAVMDLARSDNTPVSIVTRNIELQSQLTAASERIRLLEEALLGYGSV